jgi:hypothetical protein
MLVKFKSLLLEEESQIRDVWANTVGRMAESAQIVQLKPQQQIRPASAERSSRGFCVWRRVKPMVSV